MNQIIKNKSMGLITTIIFIINLFACEKNPTEPAKNAPALPPVESMKLDLSFFPDTSNNLLAKAILSKRNFNNAAGRVWIIYNLVALAAVPPAAVFAAAISQDAELMPDGKFHWIYTAHHKNIIFSADLVG